MGFYNSFVVKIWSSEVGKLERGHIQHVGTQEQRYFLDTRDLVDFVLSHLAPLADDSTTSTQTGNKQAPIDNFRGIFQDESGTQN